MNELIGRIGIFEDSKELAQALRMIASNLEPDEAYFLKEGAIQIEEMWQLLKQIRKKAGKVGKVGKANKTL